MPPQSFLNGLLRMRSSYRKLKKVGTVIGMVRMNMPLIIVPTTYKLSTQFENLICLNCRSVATTMTRQNYVYSLMKYPKKILYLSWSKFLRILFFMQSLKHATVNNTRAMIIGRITLDNAKTPARFSIALEVSNPSCDQLSVVLYESGMSKI